MTPHPLPLIDYISTTVSHHFTLPLDSHFERHRLTVTRLPTCDGKLGVLALQSRRGSLIVIHDEDLIHLALNGAREQPETLALGVDRHDHGLVLDRDGRQRDDTRRLRQIGPGRQS
jgi:hypothetical protein